jgi:hypothetical protein
VDLSYDRLLMMMIVDFPNKQQVFMSLTESAGYVFSSTVATVRLTRKIDTASVCCLQQCD